MKWRNGTQPSGANSAGFDGSDFSRTSACVIALAPRTSPYTAPAAFPPARISCTTPALPVLFTVLALSFEASREGAFARSRKGFSLSYEGRRNTRGLRACFRFSGPRK